MRMDRRLLLTVILVLALTTAGFVFGWAMARGDTASQLPIQLKQCYQLALGGELPAAGPKLAAVEIAPDSAFKQVMSLLKDQYVDPIKDDKPLFYGAIRGMMRSMGDPYTLFMSPDEYTEFKDENRGEITGIGATLWVTEAEPDPKGQPLPSIRCPNCGADIAHYKQPRITIKSPLPGTPAAKANLRAGDIILKIQDRDKKPQSTLGMDLVDAVELIRGPEGTKVTLSIARKDRPKPFDVTLQRARVNVPSVESKMLEDDIGYLRLNLFMERTETEMVSALDQLKKDHARGLVLDLRNNPGGGFDVCRTVANFFLKKDATVVITQDRTHHERAYKAADAFPHVNWPLVVLVNEGSASASEILAGAIRDNKVGELVGEKTFGKGLVQTIFPMGDGSALRITTARYLTPNKTDINKKGIEPDKMVKLPDTEPGDPIEFLSDRDTQAKAALGLLRNKMARK